MTPFVLVFSFFVAATPAQPAQPADDASAAKPAVRACASSMLPHFQTLAVPVSFQVPARQKRPQPFNFADESRKTKLKADCTGAECGCDVAEAACEARCDPNDETCLDHCTHNYVRCAVCCCCECPFCPLSCGC